jgi:hypothetical protein
VLPESNAAAAPGSNTASAMAAGTNAVRKGTEQNNVCMEDSSLAGNGDEDKLNDLRAQAPREAETARGFMAADPVMANRQ